jgi:hypothetical protein
MRLTLRSANEMARGSGTDPPGMTSGLLYSRQQLNGLAVPKDQTLRDYEWRGMPRVRLHPALLLRSGLGRSLLSETAKRSFP